MTESSQVVAQQTASPANSQRIQIRVSDLPQPDASQSASRSPQVIDRPADVQLQAPPNFKVEVFAQGLSRPRWLLVAPNGDVFLAESYDNRIRLLRDTDGNGVADFNTVFVENLNQPFGMAIAPDGHFFYVANTDAVIRFPYQPGQRRLQGQSQTITQLPGGGYNQHWTRNLIFSPDGNKLFVSIGSRGNADQEPLPRASIQVMNPDGSDRQTYASGLRNPVGLDFNPITRKLFTTVNERDGLGDDLVPDYLTSLQVGGFYGWPYSYLGNHPDPRLPRRPDLAAKAIVPEVLFQAHSAALGLVFYTGNQFPAEYRHDAFVAFRGSWNRSQGTGYKVVRVPFDSQGQPQGYYENFLTGWLVNPTVPSVWGRPVGLGIAKDGSLLVTDEPGGKIWRVSYATPVK
jgi:glucose/arabinose dehydrogenase